MFKEINELRDLRNKVKDGQNLTNEEMAYIIQTLIDIKTSEFARLNTVTKSLQQMLTPSGEQGRFFDQK